MSTHDPSLPAGPSPVSAREMGAESELPPLPVKRPRLLAFLRGVRAFFVVSLWGRTRSYFARRDPTFLNALLPFLALTSVLYSRWLFTTNYIFDEQEALLANPYVNQTGFKYQDAIYRDFWGLPPNASIGSYRPIPNYLWRGVVELGERAQKVWDPMLAHPLVTLSVFAGLIVVVLAFFLRRAPLWLGGLIVGIIAAALAVGVWFGVDQIQHNAELTAGIRPLTEVARTSFVQHWYNIFFHAVNGALFSAIAWRISKKRACAWLVGTTFVTCAVLTEAVSGCVGIADVLGGMGALLAIASLALPAYVMPFGVFLAILFGFFSKESAIVCVPLVPFAALVSAPVIHGEKPARLARTVLAAIGAVAAFVLYTEMRKLWFPSPLPSELTDPIADSAPLSQRLVHDFLVWFHQAPLPRDPLNNPFADPNVDVEHRIAGALRVYERGLGQVVFPWTLSGDYSFPQEPAPEKLVFFGSVLGAILTLVPFGASIGLFVVALRRELGGRSERKRTAEDALWAADYRSEPVPDPEAAHPPSPRGSDPAFAVSLVPTWPRRIAGYAFQAALVAVSFFLVRHILHVPPAKEYQELIDKGTAPRNIAIPVSWMLHYAPYLGGGCIAVGALVELAWKKRVPRPGLWRLMVFSVGLLWLVVSYFPHSNVPVLLPTVRAERLWYFPAMGTTMIVGVALDWIRDTLTKARWPRLGIAIPVVFLLFQAGRAYWHATDYRSDLVFWDATKDAVPNSSKAHLNYSVMVGAHKSDYQTRLAESLKAVALAPDWAMAHIYTGDTLCRMGRPDEAWPYYRDGFEKGPNDKSLISLALQCMFDTKTLKSHDAELRAVSVAHPGSWIAFLGPDTLDNGDRYGGVNPEYRPRSYNEGPKKDSASTTASDSDSGEASSDPSAEPSAQTPDDDVGSGSASAEGTSTSSGRPGPHATSSAGHPKSTATTSSSHR